MAKRTSKNKGIKLIKKANQLIEAHYKFDVWETRLFLAVLSNIRKDDMDFKPYRIWYKDVIRTFGLKSGQSYGLLRDAARSLMGKVFKVSSITEDGFQRDTEYHIIRSVNYLAEGETGKGIANQEFIDVTFDPQMKPLLLQLQKNFTAYDLQNIVKLGTYPVRVYELLKQYEVIGERTLEFEEMKRMFELTEEYPLFANFYQKVIEPSLQQINAHTDLLVTQVDKVKAGRKVVALRFVFRQKDEEELRRMRGELVEQSLLPFPEPVATVDEAPALSDKDRLFNLFQSDVVVEFGVTPSALFELLDGRTEEQLAQAVRVTRRAQAAGQIKSSVAGFFVQAVRQGFTDGREEDARKRAAELARTEARKRVMETLQDEQNERMNQRIREITSEAPEATQRAIEALKANSFTREQIEARERALGRPLDLDDYRHDALLRGLVKTKIYELHRERFEDLDREFERRFGEVGV
jgi:plasmid replication initiation protein